MNKQEAKKIVRIAVRSLEDHHVARLMEHAYYKTPIICDNRIHSTWIDLNDGSC